jgi:hypothetical protein
LSLSICSANGARKSAGRVGEVLADIRGGADIGAVIDFGVESVRALALVSQQQAPSIAALLVIIVIAACIRMTRRVLRRFAAGDFYRHAAIDIHRLASHKTAGGRGEKYRGTGDFIGLRHALQRCIARENFLGFGVFP